MITPFNSWHFVRCNNNVVRLIETLPYSGMLLVTQISVVAVRAACWAVYCLLLMNRWFQNLSFFSGWGIYN
jgi:hypothetical protein